MDEKPTFTPGPWLYRPRPPIDDWGTIRASVSDGWIVAMARDGSGGTDFDKHRADKTDPFEANGRLIAAAPDLLVACLDALATTLDTAEITGMHRPALVCKLEAAIAKALGHTEGPMR